MNQLVSSTYRVATTCSLLAAILMLGAAECRPQDTATEPQESEEAQEPKPTVRIYGFAMMDAGYDFKQVDPDWFDVVRPTKMPAFEREFGTNGNSYFSVRQTRFGVQSDTPTDLGNLKTIFEFEFFGVGADAGQTTIRLRHAYGELGQFGAGQYWSPFMDIDVFPNSVEYWGPSGMVFFRNVQFRWMPIKGETRLTVAAERPGASGDRGLYDEQLPIDGIKPRFPMPDISGEFRLGRQWGYVEIAGILRRIEYEDVVQDEFDFSGSTWGWGLNFSSNLKLAQRGVVKFQAVYGEAIENYMNDASIDIGIVPNPGDPVTPLLGKRLPVLGVVAFYDHSWSDKFASTFGWSLHRISNTIGQTDDAFHRGDYALANLSYYPINDVMVTGEFQYGRRENYRDGFTVPDYRIQFSFKYNFEWTLGVDN